MRYLTIITLWVLVVVAVILVSSVASLVEVSAINIICTAEYEQSIKSIDRPILTLITMVANSFWITALAKYFISYADNNEEEGS